MICKWSSKGKGSTSATQAVLNSANISSIQSTDIAGGIVGHCRVDGAFTNYTSGRETYSAFCKINNCINYGAIGATSSGGLIGEMELGKHGYEYVGRITIENSFWLYDIVNNIGNESHLGSAHEDSYKNYCSVNSPSNWFGRNNISCFLNGSSEDVVELLNNWALYNGKTEYKKWKYETIDGFAVPVFDE